MLAVGEAWGSANGLAVRADAVVVLSGLKTGAPAVAHA